VRDQRLRALGIGRDHRPIAWPRPKRRSIAKPRACSVVIEHDAGFGRAQQSSISASRGIPRACCVERLQRGGRSSGRAQPRQRRKRDQRCRQRDALVLAQLAGAREAEALVQAAAFGRGMQQHDALAPARRAGAHQPVADARPWQAGRTITRPMVACARPRPAQRGADDLAVALGNDALRMRERLLPVGQAVRPAQLVGQACARGRSDSVIARRRTPSSLGFLA
jgi:hypothetical protein